ncbi:chloroplast 30S ribosomal protein S20 [Tasmannia lanceolata]|uniref:chloroplast 30S ribosomal protein S20 n=1 Tax=Tasmannia lanceolata TaxID=3420 RepID=UPI004064AA87
MALHCFSSCVVLPCKPKTLSISSSSRILPQPTAFKSLRFSSNLSENAFSKGSLSLRPIEKYSRRNVVCEAAPTKKPDSAAKRARQAEKRRIYNKSKKSEMKTRMKKVFESLDMLKKKTEAQAEEILPVEKLIAEAYSAIDRAVKVGTLHRNTGANRKSRLARRKKAVEIHHGWYTPVESA